MYIKHKSEKKVASVFSLNKNQICVEWFGSCYLVGRINLWWGRNENLVEGVYCGIFLIGGISNFLTTRGFPPSTPRRKALLPEGTSVHWNSHPHFFIHIHPKLMGTQHSRMSCKTWNCKSLFTQIFIHNRTLTMKKDSKPTQNNPIWIVVVS